MRSYSFPAPSPADIASAGLGAPSFAARMPGYASSALPRPADPARLQQLAGETMGTTWSLRLDNPRMLALDAVRSALQAALDEVVAQMSHWDADSVLGRFNRAAPGSTQLLPEPFATVLVRALHWAALSDGALDPAMAPLVALWGFGPNAADDAHLPPHPQALAAARARCGWRRIGYDAANRTLTQPGGLALDLSGIAKGFGVDAGAAALQRLGLSDFLLEVGGELRAAGRRPDGRPWRVRIDPGHSPHAGDDLHIALCDCAIATSGDRWQVREHGGRRWSHTLDPRSGEPVTHALASVTVLHDHCMDADALATALTVLGPQAGLAFAQRHDVAALFAERSAAGAVALHASPAWAGAMRQ